MPIPSPHQLLRTYNLTPKNSFGQNFLADANLTRKIAEEAAPQPGARVLELGAGLGALTDQLLQRDARVVAVERDRELVPALHQVFAPFIEAGTLRVLEADAKALDWREAVEEETSVHAISGAPDGARPAFTVCGNLPYQITGPLIEKSVRCARQIERAVFLVQKEVADRLAAAPGTKSYGVLTVFSQAQFAVRRAFTIRPGAFVPQPKVDSAVVVMTPLEVPLAEENSAFRQVVKSAFAARRKTLRNAWKGLLPHDELLELAERCSISLDARGETLSVELFARVARELSAARVRLGDTR